MKPVVPFPDEDGEDDEEDEEDEDAFAAPRDFDSRPPPVGFSLLLLQEVEEGYFFAVAAMASV